MNPKFKQYPNYWRRLTFEHHPVIGWWHIKNNYARKPLGGTTHEFITNSIGMRASRDYDHICPKNKTRIIFLGDSYTAGDGVSNNQRFTDILENRYPHLEVLNFGLNGSGTDQQYLVYDTYAKSFEAHAFVFCICVENIVRNLCTCRPSFDFSEHKIVYRPKPYYNLDGDSLSLQNAPVPNEKRPFDAIEDWKCEFPYLPNHPDDAYAIYRYEKSIYWEIMHKILRMFLDKVSGFPVFIVPMPMKDHYLEKSPPSYWPRFHEFHNVGERRYVIDILTALKRSKDREKFYFVDDPHYTTLAHALVADVLHYEIGRYHPELFCGYAA